MQILREYTGRGPTEAKTTISDGTVVVALGGPLTAPERNLLRLGGAEQVKDFRDGLQTAMRDDLIAAVELAVGQRVLALLSDTEVDADLAIQVFKLRALPRAMRPRAGRHEHEEDSVVHLASAPAHGFHRLTSANIQRRRSSTFMATHSATGAEPRGTRSTLGRATRRLTAQPNRRSRPPSSGRWSRSSSPS